jgi:Vacuolar import and degradation protein
MQFWGKLFPDYPDIKYDFVKSDVVFARWKERHLVPDHKQNIHGACFAGFYCMQMDPVRY